MKKLDIKATPETYREYLATLSVRQLYTQLVREATNRRIDHVKMLIEEIERREKPREFLRPGPGATVIIDKF